MTDTIQTILKSCNYNLRRLVNDGLTANDGNLTKTVADMQAALAALTELNNKLNPFNAVEFAPN